MSLDDELANAELIVGTVSEWKRFATRHPEFVKESPRLVQLARGIFERTYSGNTADHVIHSLGYLCWQDFQEILTLAGNGHGFGALKILRGFYERLVTLRYLQDNQHEVRTFCEYEHVRAYKMANEIHQALGEECMPGEKLAEYRTARDNVKTAFMRPCTCAQGCTHQVPMHTWTLLDPVAMASKVDDGLRKHAFAGYYMPLIETHPTLTAIASRQSFDEKGDWSFAEEKVKAHRNADWAVCMAHTMVLNAFGTELEHFPELSATVGPAFEEAKVAFLAIWDEQEQPPACG